MKGKVKFFNAEKGFGFIKKDDGDKDIFFHVSGIQDQETLKQDDEVEFEIGEGKKGPNAIDIRKV